MKELMANHKSELDGAVVNDIINSRLQFRILFFVKYFKYMNNEKPISEKQAMKKKLIHNVIELVI